MGGGNRRQNQEPVEDFHGVALDPEAITGFPSFNYQQIQGPALTRRCLPGIHVHAITDQTRSQAQ